MAFRSIFRPPPDVSIPLLPLHNPPASISSLPPTKSPYHTAPQSPDLHPTPPNLHTVSFANHSSAPIMNSPTPRSPIPQSDTQIALHRHQVHLESHLQTLLDAQSEGLLTGLTGAAPAPPSHSNRSSSSATNRSTSRSTTGTATPSSNPRSSRVSWAPPRIDSAPVIPVRQPKPHRITLRSARRGIIRTTADLAILKTQQSDTLNHSISQRSDALATISRVAAKEAGLRAQIQRIETEPGAGERLRGMKAEEAGLDAEIKEVETRLWEMKARQRVLRREIGGMENAVQARLSSYRAALGLAEKEARELVARPPLLVEEGERRRGGGVWGLPVERRTLEMVRECYEEEGEVMRGEIEGLEREREALEEGGEAWAEVVEAVNGVEEALRAEMKSMQKEEEGSRGKGMRRILGRMSETLKSVEEKLVVAEEKGWNLLVAAIGAEVEALGEGYRVLNGALREAGGDDEQSQDLLEDGPRAEQGGQNEGTNDHGLEELGDGGGLKTTDALLDRSEEEDDGPGPELLFENHDDD